MDRDELVRMAIQVGRRERASGSGGPFATLEDGMRTGKSTVTAQWLSPT
jgi:hypothetical protein